MRVCQKDKGGCLKGIPLDKAVMILASDFWPQETLLNVCVCAGMCVWAQSNLTLSSPTDCSPPGFSVHRILQAKILEWVSISFSRGSSWTRDQTWVSCIGRQISLPLSHWGSPMIILLNDIIWFYGSINIYQSCKIKEDELKGSASNRNSGWRENEVCSEGTSVLSGVF